MPQLNYNLYQGRPFSLTITSKITNDYHLPIRRADNKTKIGDNPINTIINQDIFFQPHPLNDARKITSSTNNNINIRPNILITP